MSGVFLDVNPHRNGYVATSQAIKVIAFGATAVAAVENALLAVRAAVDAAKLPANLIVRSNSRGRSTIIMQAIDAPIRLDPYGSTAI